MTCGTAAKRPADSTGTHEANVCETPHDITIGRATRPQRIARWFVASGERRLPGRGVGSRLFIDRLLLAPAVS